MAAVEPPASAEPDAHPRLVELKVETGQGRLLDCLAGLARVFAECRGREQAHKREEDGGYK